MSRTSNGYGRAYECAWMSALYYALEPIRTFRVVNNTSLRANKRAWMEMSREKRGVFLRSARAAVDTILALEPRMTECDYDELLLEFQRDEAGVQGDVRDIIIKRKQIDWEVGLSIKHNHEAIKHSRLSHGLDFAKEWFQMPCTEAYWNAVRPIFDRLKQESYRGTRWSELTDKEDGVYVPLLQAFIDELQRAYQKDAQMPKKMVEYLMGTHDYYKVVSHDERQITSIHTFNIHGTLNQSSKVQSSPTHVPTVELPTSLDAIYLRNHSTNTVELCLNHNWKLSFRIHNASSVVEPSLKFDIQFMQMPASILNMECPWNLLSLKRK